MFQEVYARAVVFSSLQQELQEDWRGGFLLTKHKNYLHCSRRLSCLTPEFSLRNQPVAHIMDHQTRKVSRTRSFRSISGKEGGANLSGT